MILYPTVSTAQARQAAAFYARAGWSQRDVGEAMGWGVGKAARVLRLFEIHGECAFGRV